MGSSNKAGQTADLENVVSPGLWQMQQRKHQECLSLSCQLASSQVSREVCLLRLGCGPKPPLWPPFHHRFTGHRFSPAAGVEGCAQQSRLGLTSPRWRLHWAVSSPEQRQWGGDPHPVWATMAERAKGTQSSSRELGQIPGKGLTLVVDGSRFWHVMCNYYQWVWE